MEATDVLLCARFDLSHLQRLLLAGRSAQMGLGIMGRPGRHALINWLGFKHIPVSTSMKSSVKHDCCWVELSLSAD